MRATSRVRQAALVVAGASVLFGVVIGFWPVSATVVGDVSYSCGSGFLHSRSTWKVDSRAMAAPDQTIGISTATPQTACPSRVYRNRDFAYALVGSRGTHVRGAARIGRVRPDVDAHDDTPQRSSTHHDRAASLTGRIAHGRTCRSRSRARCSGGLIADRDPSATVDLDANRETGSAGARPGRGDGGEAGGVGTARPTDARATNISRLCRRRIFRRGRSSANAARRDRRRDDEVGRCERRDPILDGGRLRAARLLGSCVRGSRRPPTDVGAARPFVLAPSGT